MSVPIVTIPDYGQPEEVEVPDIVPPLNLKKKKLTKAEKKARKLAAKIESQKLEIRDHLKRELEISRRSAKRGRELWEEMCREIKIIEFREELQQWSKKTGRMLEKKDEKVLMILDDIDKTQNLHRRHYARQMKIMDYMIDAYKILLNTTRMLYEENASEMIQHFHEELKSKTDTANAMKVSCENVMHVTTMIVNRQLADGYQIYLRKRDSAVNREIEKRYRQRDAVVNNMRALQNQLTKFVATVMDSTLDVHKYTRIHMLMDKQRQFFVESQRLDQVEMHSTKVYAQLQQEFLNSDIEMKRKLLDLRLENKYFIQVRKSIEYEINRDKEVTFEKLALLCKESWSVKQKYKKMEKSGELLLSLAANCRKLQTEAEKVLPWGEFQVPLQAAQLTADEQQYIDDEEAVGIHVLNLKSHLDLSESELLGQVALLRNFWRRQAMVEAQVMLLRQEHKELVAFNAKYIDFIRSMTKLDNADELPEAVKIKALLVEQPGPCAGGPVLQRVDHAE